MRSRLLTTSGACSSSMIRMSKARLPIFRAVPFLSSSLSVTCRRKGPKEAIFPPKADGLTAGASSSSRVRAESLTTEALAVPRSSRSRSGSGPGSHVSIRRVTETYLKPDKGSRKSSLLQILLMLERQLRAQRRPAGVLPSRRMVFKLWAPTEKRSVPLRGGGQHGLQSPVLRGLLLEAGIEDFDVKQRRLRGGHSFRPNAQQSTQRRYKNS